MVTKIEDLKTVGTQEIELPPFADGTPFTARLRKISLFQLIGKKKIPNPLLQTVSKLLGLENEKENNIADKIISDGENLNNLIEFMLIIAENSLVEPKFKELQENDIYLTDEQLLEIFRFSVGDLQQLMKFC